jgi:hypothetical protein
MSVCINLMPVEILVTRRVAVRRRRWIAASIALACAGVVASMVVRATLRDPRGLSEELDIQNARLQRAAVDLDAARATLQSADQRLLAVGGLSDRPNWQTLLGLIAQSRTEKVAIDVVALKKAAPVAAPAVGTPGASKSPVDDGSFVIAIRGRAEAQLDVTSFALGLEQLGLFDAVRQDRLQEVTLGKKPLLEFDLVCTLAPALESSLKPKAVQTSAPEVAETPQVAPGELPPPSGDTR